MDTAPWSAALPSAWLCSLLAVNSQSFTSLHYKRAFTTASDPYLHPFRALYLQHYGDKTREHYRKAMCVQGDSVHVTNQEVREINGRSVNGIKGINGFVRSSFVTVLFSSGRSASQAPFGMLPRRKPPAHSRAHSGKSPIIENRVRDSRTCIVCSSRNLTALCEVVPIQEIASPQSLWARLLWIRKDRRRHRAR